MRWSQLLPALAFTGAASAARSTRHVGNFEKRFERAGRSAPTVNKPLKNREYQTMHKRDNTTSLFLTNATASKQEEALNRYKTAHALVVR